MQMSYRYAYNFAICIIFQDLKLITIKKKSHKSVSDSQVAAEVLTICSDWQMAADHGKLTCTMAENVALDLPVGKF